jgi:DNA-binding NtrC family response regulator
VHVGPLLRQQSGSEGRELEFIVRSLVELKLHVEELRRRLDDAAARAGGGNVGGGWMQEVAAPVSVPGLATGIEPRDASLPANVVTVRPGMSMAEVERAVIEAALRETRGNRRKAADLLQIGERTLYRKLREYQLPYDSVILD